MNKLLFILWILPVNLIFWYSLIRPQNKPADKSNRMWKLIITWLVFTRYDQVIELTGWNMTRWRLIKEATFREHNFVFCMLFMQSDLWEYLIEGKRG